VDRAAAIVVEVMSPGDDSMAKMAFSFDHGIEEILLVDLTDRSAVWFAHGERRFSTAIKSALLGIDAASVVSALGWT
jgi:Uma2 family endonuclease